MTLDQTSVRPEINELRRVMKACTRCDLRATCTQVVPWSGATPAELVFIGEAPGEKEDIAGEPFVGPSGNRLSLEASRVGLERGVHYAVLNTVSCRPPENRDPWDHERIACQPWLRAQLEILKPLVIVPVGSQALQTWKRGAQITHARGIPFQAADITGFNIIVVPTWHPRYVLTMGMKAILQFRADLLLAATLLWLLQEWPEAKFIEHVDTAKQIAPWGWLKEEMKAHKKAYVEGFPVLELQAAKLTKAKVIPGQIALFHELRDELLRIEAGKKGFYFDD